MNWNNVTEAEVLRHFNLYTEESVSAMEEHFEQERQILLERVESLEGKLAELMGTYCSDLENE